MSFQRDKSFSGRPFGGRAGYAGRGTRGGYGKKFKAQTLPNTTLHPLGELITTIDNSSLDRAGLSMTRKHTITDCQFLQSYNWLGSTDPTILIPGRPPLWTPLQNPLRLHEDRGDYFRDPNAARYPKYPTEPAVRSVLSLGDHFHTADVDIFACGSTMTNLLRYVRSEEKPFRCLVERIGNTVFFHRKENAPDELIEGVRGYGHTFPEHNTTWEKDVRGSETHQRIIEYRFAGLTCLVRSESDGYFEHLADTAEDTDDSDLESDHDDAGNALQKFSISHSASSSKDLKIKGGGAVIPQASVFDLKTRSGKYGKEINMEEHLPTLWIKQIPNFIVAYHDGAGLFPREKTHVVDVRQDIKEWEANNAVALQRFAQLLHEIIELVKTRRTIEVYCPCVDRLEIREQHKDGVDGLPTSLRQEWISRAASLHNAPDAEYHDPDIMAGRDCSASAQDETASSIKSESNKSANKEPDYTGCDVDCGYCGRCDY